MGKNILFFLSDEGYGHMIRQRAIIQEFLQSNKKYHITIITGNRINDLKEFFMDKVNYFKLHNLIETQKTYGSLNLENTKKMFRNWYLKEKHWKNKIIKNFKKVDLIISDSVPQAFQLKRIYKCLAVNISHFSWDWFYEIHFKTQDRILKKLQKYYKLSDKFYYLPYTPKEILVNYPKKVNFVSYGKFVIRKLSKKKINCLIMDNGTKSLSNNIESVLINLTKLKKFHFFIGIDTLSESSKKIISENSNLFPISGLKNMHSYIASVDFIIARGGYNTLTECLILKKPSLLMYETNNKEILHNISLLKKNNFCEIIYQSDFKKDINKKILNFVKFKKNKIFRNLVKKNFKSNGSKQIYVFRKKFIR